MNNFFIKITLYLFAVVAIIACTKESEDDLKQDEKIYTFEAISCDRTSKTEIYNETHVYWSAKDSINIFYGDKTGGKFIASNTEPAAQTTFSGKFDSFDGNIEVGINSTNFIAVYPYSPYTTCDGESVTMTVASSQPAFNGSFAPGVFPTIAKSPNLSLPFYSVCGGIRFSLVNSGIKTITIAGNADEFIAGQVRLSLDSNGIPVVSEVVDGSKTINLTMPDDGEFDTDTWYYITMLPVQLSSGFTMTFSKANAVGTRETSSSVTIKRSVFASGSQIDKDVEFKSTDYFDLSAAGKANCYLVSNKGNYKFNATVKGNGTESVGTPSKASILWESFGTSTQTKAGDIIQNVDFKDGYIKFTATEKKGNAVLAVKDASDNILWSWHIWCTDAPVDQEYNNAAGKMMDRNLGATSATPGNPCALGLLYQWGRKDPFLASSSISENTKAASSITWPTTVKPEDHLDGTNTTLAYSIANPTTFIIKAASSTCCDWYCAARTYMNNNLWSSTKTIYDPCPAGYRVPSATPSFYDGIWPKAFGTGTTATLTLTPVDAVNKGFDFGSTTTYKLGTGTIWYPFAGCLAAADGNLGSSGSTGYYWYASVYDSYRGRKIYFSNSNTNNVAQNGSGFHAYAYSVRCVAE